MTILCVGDIHIKPSNVHLIDALETQLLEIIHREQVSWVVLLGDLLDTFERIHTQALNRAYRLIDRLREHVQVFVLVGNHDLINNQQFLSTQHWMNALKCWERVTVVDRVVDRTHPTCGRILLVPYVPVQRFSEALATVPDATVADYIFAHQEFQGCKMGAIQSVHGDVWPLEYPTVISGHIHDYQRPQENVLYIGASVQNSFGDQTDPRVLCIHKRNREWAEIPLCLPKKKTIYSDLATLQSESALDPSKWETDPMVDTVRIVVRGDYEQFKTFTKSQAYATLTQTAKCKIVHKPDKLSDQPVDQPTDQPPAHSQPRPFEDVLIQKVLTRRNEWLYTAYLQVVHGDESLNAEDILIV